MKALVSIAALFEQPYIKEFLLHYFNLGFDVAHIYLNNWNNDGLSYLKNTDFCGKVIFKLFDGSVVQLKAYNDFIQNNSSQYDYALFVDCDEFLTIRSNRNLNSILSQSKYMPSMAINWRCFGNNGIESVKDGNYSMKRFTRCDKCLNPHVKQLLNLSYCRELCLAPKFVNPHFMSVISYNQEGHSVIGPWNRENLDKVHELEINHYITKSTEECKLRRSHVRADTPTPREEGWKAFFERENKNDIEESTLKYKELQ